MQPPFSKLLFSQNQAGSYQVSIVSFISMLKNFKRFDNLEAFRLATIVIAAVNDNPQQAGDNFTTI